EVNATLRPELVGLLHLVEEQAHAGTVEEREVAETVELTQADHLLVKSFRAIGIDDRQSDLADLAEVEQHVELPNGTNRIIGAGGARDCVSAGYVTIGNATISNSLGQHFSGFSQPEQPDLRTRLRRRIFSPFV